MTCRFAGVHFVFFLIDGVSRIACFQYQTRINAQKNKKNRLTLSIRKTASFPKK